MNPKYLWLLLLGAIVTGFIGYSWSNFYPSESENIFKTELSRKPIYNLNLDLKKSTGEDIAEFITAIEKYCYETGFAIRVARIHPTKEEYSFKFWRDDYNFSGVILDGEIFVAMYRTGNYPDLTENMLATIKSLETFLSTFGKVEIKRDGGIKF